MIDRHIVNIGYPRSGTSWLWNCSGFAPRHDKENTLLMDNLNFDQYVKYYSQYRISANFQPNLWHVDTEIIKFVQQHASHITLIVRNPFDFVDLNKLTFTEEGIKIKDEHWNSNIFQQIYSQDIFESCKDYNVICGGVFGGPAPLLIDFCEKFLQEWEKIKPTNLRGMDQPILNKMIRTEESLKPFVDIKTLLDEFCVNLHVPVNYTNLQLPVEILSNKVLNKNTKQKYAIVHQYNRTPALYQEIKRHFVGCYYPIY